MTGVDLTQLGVALIGAIAVVLTALLGESRRATRTLGRRGKDEPSLMEVLVAIHHRLGAQEEHNAHQDGRLSSIEHTVKNIDGRVINLEDLAKTQAAVDDAARRGIIDRREDDHP